MRMAVSSLALFGLTIRPAAEKLNQRRLAPCFELQRLGADSQDRGRPRSASARYPLVMAVRVAAFEVALKTEGAALHVPRSIRQLRRHQELHAAHVRLVRRSLRSGGVERVHRLPRRKRIA